MIETLVFGSVWLVGVGVWCWLAWSMMRHPDKWYDVDNTGGE